jgi:hypothetical protein
MLDYSLQSNKFHEEYLKGWTAFERGKRADANPYPDGSEPFKAWNEGQRLAKAYAGIRITADDV